ncbi:hypothetical protein [Psychroserpens sp. SPM9]|uniref:hypothetical protein n=1 Tax=Psychroserpens sp. SPM9 TaxID=2975598 RepID=UPI0021A60F5B|nr:hypothetical protein [Psychroserpens sp. SPM9]MDG5491274.1 hypothetical protein [Psychroserpens sp. SPM9]
MKLSQFTLGILMALMILACSSDSDNPNDQTDPTVTKQLKQISWSNGYSEKYVYDASNRLELIVHSDIAFINEEANDSTFISYQNDKISNILKREQSGDEIVNSELQFLEFTSNNATGTRTIFTDSGDTYMEQTFEYTFSGHLLKSYKTYNLNGNIHFVQEYAHNSDGNLITFNEISYDSAINEVVYEYHNSITQWDDDKQVTERLFSWDAISLPGFYLSNNNCLNLISDSTTYAYTFEYDTDNYVTKYNLDDGSFFTLEYYD